MFINELQYFRSRYCTKVPPDKNKYKAFQACGFQACFFLSWSLSLFATISNVLRSPVLKPDVCVQWVYQSLDKLLPAATGSSGTEKTLNRLHRVNRIEEEIKWIFA